MKDFQRIIDYSNTTNSFMLHNGIQITGANETQATGILPVGPEMLNPLGIVHGGAYFTLFDCLSGVLARVKGYQCVTLNGDTHFIRNVSSGVVTGTAKLIHRGKTICLVETTATDEAGNLLATGRFTMFQKPVPISMPVSQ